ncbi:cytochrome P450 [Croceicoccus sp. BE223]|uniref:cytochrome P450 n=1 Tax=Croceicoccus sp. BE223 TaxID=2817716 RepID=UPI002857A278|nr:cytochrome P450 [Croceicoccus sp. BE223]MDR7103700.1 cytochrome P450 [Croceicoccus sp. BE223]
MSEPATIERQVPIEDPNFYLDDPWPTFEWMQREAPFYMYEPLRTYVITRHRDIMAIAPRADVFSNARGIFLNEIKYREQAGDANFSEGFWPEGGEQIGNTDPPRHQELRRVSQGAFTVPAIQAVQEKVAAHVDRMMDEMGDKGEVDYWDFAAGLPIEAACHLIGLPATDRARVQHWSDELEKLGADIPFQELMAAVAGFDTLKDYITENVERCKAERAEGNVHGLSLIDVLLDAELDGIKGVKLPNVITFAMTAMAAGADTTRALLLGLPYYLAKNPDQWQRLKQDRSLVKTAIEETLRLVSPARAFLRYVHQDVEINGQQMKEGEHVYLMYWAANRDPEVFADPHKFDAGRANASRHLAFGAGPHVCLGSRLARMEGIITLNAMLDKFERIELTAEPKPVVHIIRNSWENMPLRFVR